MMPALEPVEERIGGYAVHPVAAMFPLLKGDDYEELHNSIYAHGLQRPIVLLGDVLLDGRNRLRICLDLGIEPKVEQYSGPVDPVDYILAANVDRRHLDVDTRVGICTKIRAWRIEQRNAARRKEATKEGGRGRKKNSDTKTYPSLGEPKTEAKNARSTVGQIAEAAKVSHHKAAQAVAVAKAAPDLLNQVAAGAIKLKDAFAQVRAAAPAAPKAPPKPPPRFDAQKAAASCGRKISDWITHCPAVARTEFKALVLEECKKLCGK